MKSDFINEKHIAVNTKTYELQGTPNFYKSIHQQIKIKDYKRDQISSHMDDTHKVAPLCNRKTLCALRKELEDVIDYIREVPICF